MFIKVEIEKFIEAFHQNPKTVMNQLPYKEGVINSRFTDKEIQTGDFFYKKQKSREDICKVVNTKKMCANDIINKVANYSNDRAIDLVDNRSNLLTNLYDIERKGLTAAKLPERPWSDDYWPIARGGLGYRYADRDFTNYMGGSFNWKRAYDWILEHPADTYGYYEKNFLSPSEKYDLLVGDNSMQLTRGMWKEGEGYYNSNGSVETWMGICHGWASAAYMLKRPTEKVDVKLPDGSSITFYHSDIKALASLLWAKAPPATRFIGGRCNDKNPNTDRFGRVIKQECFDTNPKSWHESVINQIGVSKRSFIMDAKYDYEVWNQPVFSYDYHYFNVNDQTTSKNWANVAINIDDYGKDKFSTWRNSGGNYVVGVVMNVTYISEISPGQNLDPWYDSTVKVTYYYDLEIDRKGNIVGGEWYTNKHPDFLWTPTSTASAGLWTDQYAMGRWTGESIPASWKRYAASISQKRVPIRKIVEELISRSTGSAPPPPVVTPVPNPSDSFEVEGVSFSDIGSEYFFGFKTLINIPLNLRRNAIDRFFHVNLFMDGNYIDNSYSVTTEKFYNDLRVKLLDGKVVISGSYPRAWLENSSRTFLIQVIYNNESVQKDIFFNLKNYY